MITYKNTKVGFIDEPIESIVKQLRQNIKAESGLSPSNSEVLSWTGDEHRMGSIAILKKLFSDAHIPDNCGVILEYGLPITDYRIDCILTGKGQDGKHHIILFELKGWEQAQLCKVDGMVKTYLGGELTTTSHPSYQAKWYKDILDDYEEVVHSQNVIVHPCAYLYNCISKEVINNTAFEKYTKVAPAFCQKEEEAILDFIKGNIHTGDNGESVELIENSQHIPSKRLLDSLGQIVDGENAFHLSPAQFEDFNKVLCAIRWSEEQDCKVVLNLPGKPGSGKTVIAVNLVFSLLREAANNGGHSIIRYISKTRPPRVSLRDELSNLDDGAAANLISYIPNNHLHIAIVDEAHRLMVDQQVNQIERVVDKSDISVFFTDMKQRVSVEDIGTDENIKAIAEGCKAKYRRLDELTAQFRSGITGWVEHLLQYDDAPLVPLPNPNYFDFRVFDNPAAMFEAIKEQDAKGFKSRVVAGYCRRWDSRNNHNVIDWDYTKQGFPDFKHQWNFNNEGNWATRQGVDTIGCIHTCQGMEFEGCVGVIIPKELSCTKEGVLEFHPEYHAPDDPGIPAAYCKKMEKLSSSDARLISELIKNTYYVLLTRGMKGTYIYAEDPGLSEYIKGMAKMSEDSFPNNS